MRIAQVAPLHESVPPRLYGGTERVVQWLTEELVRRGHEVTLFASGDSKTSARLVPICPQALRLDPRHPNPLPWEVLQMERVAALAEEFDVVHFHSDLLQLPIAKRLGVPHLTTLHGRLDLLGLNELYSEFKDEPLVSISDAQRKPLSQGNWLATVHHGLPADLLPLGDGTGGYFAFLGRISQEKGPERAIEIAKRTGVPLKIAAKIDHSDETYFEEVIRPLLDHPLIEFLGEVDQSQKAELLGGARALLFPIDWPEPFGLVMIEALACGTPVVAFRHGSVPELIHHGVTGFIVEDLECAVDAALRSQTLSRVQCRKEFERRFSATTMAEGYEQAYALADRPPSYAPASKRGLADVGSMTMAWAEDTGEFPVQAPAGLLDSGTRVLKHDDTFLVCERHGEVISAADSQLGLYHGGTRHLSDFRLTMNGARLLLLGSTVRDDNVLLVVELMNPDLPGLSHGTVHVRRERLLWDGAMHERIELTSFASTPVTIDLTLDYEGDFVDLFEVRGTPRHARGRRMSTLVQSGVKLRYMGLDEMERQTQLDFEPAPQKLGPRRASFRFELPRHGKDHLEVKIRCKREQHASSPGFDSVLTSAQARLEVHALEDCSIETSNELFGEWLRRSQADLRMMMTETAQGRYPYAGVPWYSTPFGRDAIITALQGLWVNPSLAAGVLEFLAAFQAHEVEDERDAEPGKILHEMRGGEMAALGEVPFARYYGSVDSTPLFVLLAGRYLRATNDLALVQRLWPNVLRAIAWMDTYGDRDGDGFVEYGRRTATGLQQQGWKDSHDSVFHADGSQAKGPIAVCEVQAYVFAARKAAAEIATALDEPAFAREQLARSSELRERFEQAFWCDDLSMYALALDGEKRPCKVRTSNAGHCLFAGIAHVDRARRVADQLLGPDMFSGWGVRTLAVGEKCYNPMAYHNGSVWPHDNALIAEGLSAYGLKSHVLRILTGLFQMSREVELHRLPELICGFERRQGGGPTLYPVACAPQAWAAASVFMLLGAALGLSVDARERRVTLTQPVLPSWLQTVRLRNLRVGNERVDLTLTRYPEDVALTVDRRTGPVDVVVWK